MRVVGVTGGIASGKSTLMGMFRSAGVPGIDSDRIVHRLLRKGTRVFHLVKSAFGPACLDQHGNIDRRALGRRVFSDVRARRRLERIVHPAVFAEIDRSVRRLARRRVRLAAVDIPLLYETKSEIRYDVIVVAYVPRSVQILRLLRRGMPRLAARARIQAQWSLEWKRRRADVVFDMTKPLGRLKGEVVQWIQKIRGETRVSAKRSSRS